jgi:hypothetical protein
MSTCEPVRLRQQRVLALDVALLEIGGLARKRDAPPERGEVGFQVGEFGAHGGEPRLGLRHADAERLGSISISASPAFTRWPSVTVTWRSCRRCPA